MPMNWQKEPSLGKLTHLVSLPQHDENDWLAQRVCYLVENHCPIGIAANTRNDLCTAELQRFYCLFGKDDRIERTFSGSQHCVYLIRLWEH